MINRKIVINECYGGFGLSPEAIKRYLELKGKKCYFYKTDYATKEYIKIDDNLKNNLFFSTFTEDIGEIVNFDDKIKMEELDKYYFSDTSIQRDDKDLIKVIEELGDKASGQCASLKIVEIPKDIDWEIDEYDGLEAVEEKHRRWN